MTFDDICLMDARIRELERDVIEFSRVYARKRHRCANAAWYGFGEFFRKGFKPRVLKLVGYERKPSGYITPVLPPVPRFTDFNDPVWDECLRLINSAKAEAIAHLGPDAHRNERALSSPVAYDVVYDHLYKLLPDCRGCLCG